MKAWRFPVLCVLLFTTAGTTYAQDLDRGKSAAQIFSSNCSVCHRGPQGLSKGGDLRATASFLGQHYTTSAESAGAIAAYLVSVGGDPRTARLRASTEPADVAQGERGEASERSPAAAAQAPGRERKPGEPATVLSDPPPIVTTSDPVSLGNDRMVLMSPPSPAPAARATPAPTASASAANATPGAAPSGQGSGAAAGGVAAAPPAAAAEAKAQEGFSSPLP